MSHIFVSYKRENLDAVELLVNELKRHHYVWFDQTGIPGGTEWEDKINAALDETSALILMVTPNALTEWVKYEYQKALSKGVLVIPFMLEDCELPTDLGGRQKIFGSDAEAFEKLIDALPDTSRIWGDIIIPQSELLPQRTFSQLAGLCSGGLLHPTAQLIGIPIKQTRYCKVYLVGKYNDTLEQPLDNYQLALQLTSRNFSLTPTADGSYPQDEFARDIAKYFLISPSKHIRLYLVQGPLNQPYDSANRLGFGLSVKRPSEWSDVVEAADYVRAVAKGKLMQLFVNGPSIMTYKLGASNPGFSRYELYQLDYNGTGYYRVLQG